MSSLSLSPFQAVDEMLARLDQGFPDVANLPVEEVRGLLRARMAAVLNRDDVASSEDIQIENGPLVRFYRPHGQNTQTPVILYFHGGGWVFCSLDSHDAFCRRLSRETGAAVLSVDYPLAPEHPYPAALHSGVKTLKWVGEKAASLELDPNRIFVMGDSAGGNLAAALCLWARDHGGHAIAGQILLYPVLDPDFGSLGYRKFGKGHYNHTTAMRYYWQSYLGTKDLSEPADYAAPLRTKSLANLPPAVIVLPGRDPTCTEGERFAKRLQSEGCLYRLRLYPDLFHGFMTMLAFAPAESPRQILWSDLRNLISDQKEA